MNRLLSSFALLILITGCGGGSGSSSDLAPAQPPANPSIPTFNSSSNSIFTNESIAITWSSNNASTCIASGDWDGQKASAGSESLQLQEAKTYTFILTCSGEAGTQPATASLDVVVIEPPAPAPKLSSVSFLLEDNDQLENDIALEEQPENAFFGRVPFNTSLDGLAATYEFIGSSIQINDVEQENGITRNNFTDIVNVKVINKDGDSETYQINITKFTGLPIVYIETDGSAQIDSKDDYVLGDTNIDGGRDYENFPSAPMKIRGRGNSTWQFPKKPFQMKLDDKAELLGMPNDKKWLFLAEYADKTMLRNTIAFEMGYISNLDWTPEAKFAEVFINGNYNGTYNITQKVEESDNRVAIGDTGYLLELDQLERLDSDDVYFESAVTERFIINIKEPNLDAGSDEFTYIQNLITNFENNLFSENFTDEAAGYRQFIDMDSFIDWFLISEITKNVDSMFFSSIYLNVMPGEKIKMGPLWDFDLSFGNVDYADSRYPEGWWVKYNPWYERLFEDPEFVEAARNRFEYFNNNRDYILDKIDTYAEKLKWAQEENDDKWQTIGVYVWPNPVIFDTYQEEVDHMKAWYETRMDWLESALDDL
jgi:spore coat protein CotH